MIGLFLVTHGTLGEALIQCVCHVLDKRPPLLGQLGLSAAEDPADALPLARRMIATVDEGDGVLLLADLYGATPCNVATRLLARPHTGRKHQIRVHLASRGHPIVGDQKYGRPEKPKKRLALHALSLAFTHPYSKKPMAFESQIPGYFQQLMADSL